jgi:SecD/SecF fusion protein
MRFLLTFKPKTMLKSLSKKTRLIAQVLLILLIAGGLSVVDLKLPLKLGLDLAGGTQLDYKIDLSRVAEADQSQIIEGVKEVIRRRVDSLGVAEPNIYTSNIADEYHVVVELAGISNIDEAKKSVGKTIQLEFKEENTEPSAGKVEQAKARSQSAYEALLSGANFAELSEEEKLKYPEMASATAAMTQEIGEMSEGLKVALEGKQRIHLRRKHRKSDRAKRFGRHPSDRTEI